MQILKRIMPNRAVHFRSAYAMVAKCDLFEMESGEWSSAWGQSIRHWENR